MERVGIIGLGRMGSVIARRMVSQGHDVTGWTRSHRSVAGITTVTGIDALVAQSDTLILSLYDDAAVGEVLDRLVTLDLSGKQIIETSTVAPSVLLDRMDRIATQGAVAVDAPISGGPELVLAGACGIFIGGDAAAAERAQASLSAISGRIFHVGPLGAGLVMKTINNTMIQTYIGALAELMPLAKRAGLPMETALNILCGGPASMPMLQDRMPKILGADPTVGFPLSAAQKDNGVFQRVAQAYGVTLPLLALAVHPQQTAIKAGFAEDDVAAMIPYAYQAG